MAKFHFFTDLDLLNPQQTHDAFGIVANTDPDYISGKDRFRVTSLHSANGNPLAYAVCRGQLLVQPDINDSSLVNIILKPEIQPRFLPKIKFFIYRGIIKSSLTDGTNVANNTNTLTKYINDNATDLNDDVLGINLYNITNFQDADLVDNAFFMNSVTLWTAKGGWSIGTFDPNQMGFEIIFDAMGFNPTFGLARINKNYVEVDSLTGGETDAQIYTHWTNKEVLLNYLDPAAFYGSFYDDKVYSRISADPVDADLVPEFTKRAGNDIYENILNGGVNGSQPTLFYNRNKVYFDLRNELNYSFNYFRNYTNAIKISYLDDGIEPVNDVDYYQDIWPVLMLNNIQSPDSEITIKVALPVGDNYAPLIYVRSGKLKIPLLKKLLKGNSKFIDLTRSEDDTVLYTADSFIINTPNFNPNIPVCSYVKVKYLKSLSSANPLPSSEGSVLRAKYFQDHAFAPLDMIIPHAGNERIKIKIYDEDFFMDVRDEYGVNYVAKTGIASDTDNITLFATVSDLNTRNVFKPESTTIPIVNEATDGYDSFLVHLDAKTKKKTLKKTELVVAGDDISILKFDNDDVSFIERYFSPNLDKYFFAFVFTGNQFNDIKNLITSNYSLPFKTYIGIKERTDWNLDETDDVDDNGKKKMNFEFVLRGLKDNGSGVMEVFELATGIMGYGFFTTYK